MHLILPDQPFAYAPGVCHATLVVSGFPSALSSCMLFLQCFVVNVPHIVVPAIFLAELAALCVLHI
jgi:hypothetical protein